MACPGRFELPTLGLEGRCSIRAELRAAEFIIRELVLEYRAEGPAFGLRPSGERRAAPALVGFASRTLDAEGRCSIRAELRAAF